MTRIEIIAIGKDKIHSIGYVTVSKKGDVYHILKIGHSYWKTSRHANSGSLYWNSPEGSSQKIRTGVPINDFKGIETLGVSGFGLDSLPELSTEYKMKKCDGIFAVDMREYKDASFNMRITILTKEGLSKLYDSWQKLKKRQIYLYTDCHPMIAITIEDAKV